MENIQGIFIVLGGIFVALVITLCLVIRIIRANKKKWTEILIEVIVGKLTLALFGKVSETARSVINTLLNGSNKKK